MLRTDHPVVEYEITDWGPDELAHPGELGTIGKWDFRQDSEMCYMAWLDNV